jgi:hypothetical protein
MDAGNPTPAGKLSFETAAPSPSSGSAGKSCALCRTAIDSVYHFANAQVICPPCRAKLEGHGGDEISSASRFFRAALLGSAAAVAGSLVYWAVLAIANMQLSLISILVGFMVGRAVQRGSRNRGEALYQVLAVGLTYLSIAISFVPLIVQEASRGDDVATYIAALMFSLTLPIRAITFDPLTVVIIAIGLWQAWKQARGPELNLSGPYYLAPANAPAQPATTAG